MDPAALELVGATLRRLRTELDAAACSFALLDGDTLVFTAADGAGADDVVGLEIPVSRGIAGWVVVSGEAVAVADVASDRRWDRRTAEQTGYVPRSILAVPVDDGDSTLGVLEVLDRGRDDDAFGSAAGAAREVALLVGLSRTRTPSTTVPGPPPALLPQLERLSRATPGEQRLVARLLDAVLDPDE